MMVLGRLIITFTITYTANAKLLTDWLLQNGSWVENTNNSYQNVPTRYGFAIETCINGSLDLLQLTKTLA